MNIDDMLCNIESS